ncbi:MAG: hypothetical protein J1E16_04135 [Muribaculaceae bacterium]|nr:hypothetical protein [Muribaculaceae bacterium]
MADVIEANVGGEFQQPTNGSAGLQTQVPGQPTTVSSVSGATGGIAPGNLIEREIDRELFRFKSDDTPLMQVMLMAKTVKVNSPEVDHYMIDEPRSDVRGLTAVTASPMPQFTLPLEPSDAFVLQGFGTLLAQGIDGYTPDGQKQTPGKDLMLFVVGIDTATGNPICRALNGPKTNADDEFCTTPEIPAGTTFIILGNALYETQKEVAPDLIVPQPTTVFLQKRGMNQIVSDYFESQKKRIPFSKAMIAEQALTNFKVRGNRTLWASRASKFAVTTEKVGTQLVYTTEGVRWQVKKELQHIGKWTFEQFIALAKMIFTGEDVPKVVLGLCGKNFLENIQCIDYKNHPEIQICQKTNEKMGWVVTSVHTVFGDFEFKHDPTLDRLRWSNSALMLATDRVVHYVYSAEHKSKDRIEGEEATRESLLVWDALALKGSCHIWINGENNVADGGMNSEATHIHYWEDETTPANPQEGCVYYLLVDCPGIADNAKAGSMWQYKNGAWSDYNGELVWG